jgi:hypothetical protein
MGSQLTLAVLEMEKTVCTADRAASVSDKREIILKVFLELTCLNIMRWGDHVVHIRE